ncbi:MAG: AIR synthase family protein [Chloroflexota bacterium]|nr:AIR synthase family protein [Chloroflexota bacterium]
MQPSYPLGKLPADHLARLFDRYGTSGDRVVLGPGIGHDAAVVSFGDRYLVAKTDPITFASEEIGWYAVHVNANDVACTGATARWFLATVLLPQSGTDEALVDEIFEQIAHTCEQLDIALVGGHTEITHGLARPIVAGFMLGEVAPDALVRPDGARPGDSVLLTKGIAVEGTAIIALERGAQLEEVERSLVERSRRFLHEPGISVVRDAAVATAAGKVHAMHDPTEGGLATGLWELADGAEVGLIIEQDAIPILPETAILCQALGLNPLGLIASGALLLAVSANDAAEIEAALEREGIAAAHIGQVVEREEGVTLRRPEGRQPLPRFDQDEITRLFE